VTFILRKPGLPALCVITLITGCSDSGPPLTATDIVAVAPVPGRDFSAAYLTLHNYSQEPITIHRLSSPDFSNVEMHESVIADDVIRMRKLDSLTLDAGTSVRFVSGGKHLMLMEPKPGLAPDDTVTLRFEYDADGLLIVSTSLKARK